jgi:hypothetical protein
MRLPRQPELSQQDPPASLPGSGSTSAARSVDTATLELLRSWQREDDTSDPAQLKAAEKELAEFRKAVNDARASSGEPLLYT